MPSRAPLQPQRHPARPELDRIPKGDQFSGSTRFNLNGYIWSPALIYLCVGAGLHFSIRTRFMQVRGFNEMIRLMFDGKSSEAGVSSFQALTMALSGRVSTGNIAGVATAITFGGPGAVFWMWMVAFLGASTAYIET